MCCIFFLSFLYLQADGDTPNPPVSPPSYADLEETAKQERIRLEELIKSKGLKYGSYPRFIVAVKGQKVSVSNFADNMLQILYMYELVVNSTNFEL